MEVGPIDYRVEKKFLVTDADLAVLRPRIEAVMELDEHQQGDCYEIRSIYFDDVENSCVRDIEAGVDNRKKYRIRSYDCSRELIRLEIKEKLNGLNRKQSCLLSGEEYELLLSGDALPAFGSKKQLNELLLRMKLDGMKPKTLICYERTAFVYPAGNVRITFDRNIAASPDVGSFFAPRPEGEVPVLPYGSSILEVKYDELLPDIIASQLEIGKLRQSSFSKYHRGRLAVSGDLWLQSGRTI